MMIAVTDRLRFEVDSLEDLELLASRARPPVSIGDRARVRVRDRLVELEVVELVDAIATWSERR